MRLLTTITRANAVASTCTRANEVVKDKNKGKRGCLVQQHRQLFMLSTITLAYDVGKYKKNGK